MKIHENSLLIPLQPPNLAIGPGFERKPKGTKSSFFIIQYMQRNSTGCSCLLLINDRVPHSGTQRVSFFFLKFSFSMWNGELSCGPYGGKGIKATDWNRMKKGKRVAFVPTTTTKKHKRQPAAYFQIHHASFTLQYSFALSMNCQFICLQHRPFCYCRDVGIRWLFIGFLMPVLLDQRGEFLEVRWIGKAPVL